MDIWGTHCDIRTYHPPSLAFFDMCFDFFGGWMDIFQDIWADMKNVHTYYIYEVNACIVSRERVPDARPLHQSVKKLFDYASTERFPTH